MASVPVSGYDLNAVLSITGGQSLTQAFSYACYDWFHPSYRCSRNRLLDFRCYTEVNAKAINFCVFNSYSQSTYKYQCACIIVNPPLVSGECFDIQLNGSAEVDYSEGSSAYACAWSSCGYLNLQANIYNNYCYGDTCFTFYYGSSSTILILANSEYGLTNTAAMYIADVVPINGSYCIGGCSSLYVQTGY